MSVSYIHNNKNAVLAKNTREEISRFIINSHVGEDQPQYSYHKNKVMTLWLKCFS